MKRFIFALVAAVLMASGFASAQAHWWMGSAVTYKNGGTFHEIWVHDYSGVCIYVSVTFISGYASGPMTSIAAVPKTQLPSGIGCE